MPSCGRVNSSKGSEGPSDFLRRSRDGEGLEYEIVKFCEYVQRYYAVKVEYGLSFKSNKTKLFKRCGINLRKTSTQSSYSQYPTHSYSIA